MSAKGLPPHLQDSDSNLKLDSPVTNSNFVEPLEIGDMGLEDRAAPKTRPGDFAGWLVAVVALAVMVCYSWILVLSNNPKAMKWFALHPTLQTLAIALFTYGILTLQPTNMSQPKAKRRGLQRHQLFMLYVGLPLITIGTLSIIYTKFSNESPHFTSWHGTLGIIAVSWMTLQIALGGASVWFGGRALGRDPKRVYKYHRASGYGLITLFLMVTHIGGAWSNFSMKNGNTPMRIIAYIVCPALIIFAIGSRARLDKMRLFS